MPCRKHNSFQEKKFKNVFTYVISRAVREEGFRKRNGEMFHLLVYSPKRPQQPGVGEAIVRRQEFHPDLPNGSGAEQADFKPTI